MGLRLAEDGDEDNPVQPGLFDQEFGVETGGVTNSENPEIVPEGGATSQIEGNSGITPYGTGFQGVDGENGSVTPPQAQNENVTPPNDNNAPPDEGEPEIMDLEDF